jgi:hypothetical protein
LTKDEFLFRPLGSVRVVGRDLAEDVYELQARVQEADDLARKVSCWSEKALVDMKEHRWEDAVEKLQRILEVIPDDTSASIYLDECRRRIHKPPPDGWKPIIELSQK